MIQIFVLFFFLRKSYWQLGNLEVAPCLLGTETFCPADEAETLSLVSFCSTTQTGKNRTSG